MDAYSPNLAATNAWDTIERLVPKSTYHPGNADPDNAAAGTVIVHGLRCLDCGTELGDGGVGIGRTSACPGCGRGRYLHPSDPEAIAALAELHEKAPGSRLRRRGAR